jgi:hypothetical protein
VYFFLQYPLVVTGMCTAMRRGDCCTLLRSAVDLEGGFITVKTAKTGETVQIPVFPLLRWVLEKALAKPAPRPPFYVFPDLEAHYRVNPDHLTDRVRRVMKAAGFFNPKEDEAQRPSRGAVQQKREHGLRKAALRDFHSFRVTWVTVALTAGVPLEIVQKVMGHRTTAIVLKHYFQPGRGGVPAHARGRAGFHRRFLRPEKAHAHRKDWAGVGGRARRRAGYGFVMGTRATVCAERSAPDYGPNVTCARYSGCATRSSIRSSGEALSVNSACTPSGRSRR